MPVRLLSFIGPRGATYGIATEAGIVDAGARHGGDLRELMLAGKLRELEPLASSQSDYDIDDVRFLPVIPSAAARFFCVGINYRPHMIEMGREPPDRPVVFVRFPSSLVGHGEPLIRPEASDQFDFEGELAVVIGRPGRRIGRDRALDHVAGFACFNDGSVRDFQRHSGQFTPGKNFDGSGAFGPWMVTHDEITDPGNLELTTRLNGDIVQRENTGELLFGIAELIEYISVWTELKPGDVIATGTPGGVGAGRNPPLWMQPGDRVEVEISGLGILSNPVVAQHAG